MTRSAFSGLQFKEACWTIGPSYTRVGHVGLPAPDDEFFTGGTTSAIGTIEAVTGCTTALASCALSRGGF